jgi:hypothetical protein
MLCLARSFRGACGFLRRLAMGSRLSPTILDLVGRRLTWMRHGKWPSGRLASARRGNRAAPLFPGTGLRSLPGWAAIVWLGRHHLTATAAGRRPFNRPARSARGAWGWWLGTGYATPRPPRMAALPRRSVGDSEGRIDACATIRLLRRPRCCGTGGVGSCRSLRFGTPINPLPLPLPLVSRCIVLSLPRRRQRTVPREAMLRAIPHESEHGALPPIRGARHALSPHKEQMHRLVSHQSGRSVLSPEKRCAKPSPREKYAGALPLQETPAAHCPCREQMCCLVPQDAMRRSRQDAMRRSRQEAMRRSRQDAMRRAIPPPKSKWGVRDGMLY